MPLKLRWPLKSEKDSKHHVLFKFQQKWSRKICSKIHKRINYIWYNQKLHERCKESVILPVCRKGDTRYCSKDASISLSSKAYKIFSVILSRLTTNVEKINGYHLCVSRGNRSATDHIFCLRQTLENKWK